MKHTEYVKKLIPTVTSATNISFDVGVVVFYRLNLRKRLIASSAHSFIVVMIAIELQLIFCGSPLKVSCELTYNHHYYQPSNVLYPV
jgi:hypothetical protein